MSVGLRFVTAVALLLLAACTSGAPTVVVRVGAEMAGGRCPNGGVAIQTGFDTNNNQVLDDSEVNADQTKYVCNGAPGTAGTAGAAGPAGSAGDAGNAGLNAISQLTVEPPGANCQVGGVRVDAGLDANGDGVLSAAEISSTRYLCDHAPADTIYFGDITLRNADDLAQLNGIQVIAGSLFVETVDGGVLTLPDLRVVANQLSFDANNNSETLNPNPVTAANFPQLRRTGELLLTYHPGLTTLTTPRLQRARRVVIGNNDDLAAISFPALTAVDGLDLHDNPLVTTLSFPVLQSAQEFRVNSQVTLTSLTAPMLTEVPGYFSANNNALLSLCQVYRLLAHLTVLPTYSLYGNDETPVCTGADLCTPPVTVTGLSNPLRPCLGQVNFAAAQTACASLGTGAALAWVTSDAEWIALSAAVSTFPITGWIGYSDQAVEGTWVAVSGFTGYTPTGRNDFWAAGGPPAPDPSRNAASINSAGQVSDAPDTYRLPFICRVP